MVATEKYGCYLVLEELRAVGNDVRDSDATRRERKSTRVPRVAGHGVLEHGSVPEEQFAFLLPHPLHHCVRRSNDSALR